MAKILILGGGFAGVVAAERLAADLGEDHQITLVSRTRNFVFHPALVRLAFGKCRPEDVSFDLHQTMLSHRVNFIEAEVAQIHPDERRVTIAHGEVEGRLPYDYLIFAMGRRLATERIPGFYEHAHHLLNVDKALNFGGAVNQFHRGHAVIGQCPEARLPVPVYETAFALSRLLKERGEREQVRITITSPDPLGFASDDPTVMTTLQNALAAHEIDVLPDFPIKQVMRNAVVTGDGQTLNFDLLMLVPPFEGSPAVFHLGITNHTYINVDRNMRAIGVDRMYAVGDCVNFSGPKMGHMAVRQAEVAATNLIAEIAGRPPVARYNHELRVVIDEGGADSIYVHKDIWTDEPASVRHGRFWSWAKRAQEKYWEAAYS